MNYDENLINELYGTIVSFDLLAFEFAKLDTFKDRCRYVALINLQKTRFEVTYYKMMAEFKLQQIERT